MHFSLSSDQVSLRDAVRDLLGDVCPPATVRAAWSSPVPAVWERLAELGLFGAMVPESAGGLGLTESDLVPVLMEVGYAAVPHPVAETVAVAAPLLATADILRGKQKVAIALPSGLIPYGRDADLVLVVDDAVRLVAPGSVRPASTVDGSWAAVTADLPDGDVVTADPELVRRAGLRADLAAAAQLVGLGRRMLDLTTAYVTTRHQFGAPVGSFQAVKHHLADAVLALEFAAPAVLAAGYSVTSGDPDAARAVSLAAVFASEAATLTAKTAIQCHGAIGYTVEYDLHLYAKRAWALAATIDVDEHLSRLADALELGGPA